ncbi:MAG: hypothetical protein J5529_01235 [Prevotella sp.]|nr:hypothetical protein [Prevotella sp.]
MKHPILLTLLFLLLLPGLKTRAAETIIDLTAQGYENAQDVGTVTSGEVTLKFSKSSGSNGPKYYTTGDAVRFYGGNTLSVEAGGKPIITINLTFTNGYAPTSDNFSVTPGSATLGVNTVWTGNSTKVLFFNTASKGQWRLQKIAVTTQEEPLTEVSTISDLRSLANGTKVRLILGVDNPGSIEYVENDSSTYAYVRDSTMALSFKDFLPDDAGWHTDTGGALIGSVDGEYHFRDGMPEFTHITSSIADSILCLDNWHSPTPIPVSDLSVLSGPDHRADYVVIDTASLRATDDDNYTIERDGETLEMTNRFGVSDLIPSDLQGREFTIHGILGAGGEDLHSVLYYTQIDEIIPNIILGETLYTNNATIGTYDSRTVNVHVERNLRTNTWNTLCLPFDIYEFSDIVSSSKLAAFTGYNAIDNSLEFSAVDDLEAGKPYLVFPMEDVEGITIQGADIVSGLSPVTFGPYDMVGVYEPTTLYAGDTNVLFLGENNTLYHPNVTNDLKAFRAYFKTTSDTPANICIDGVMSGITTATLDGASPDSPLYNLGGQRVGTPERLQKGVYVRAGSKVIIK